MKIFIEESEIERLEEVIGSLLISQFETQDEYKKVVGQIIYHFFKSYLSIKYDS